VDQIVQSLSSFEGGLIDELRILSKEESGKGGKIGGAAGYGPLKAEANLSKDQKVLREENILLKRTGYSQITTLLDKLRELGALGVISLYTPEVYEQIEEGELYEFKADIRFTRSISSPPLCKDWPKPAEIGAGKTRSWSRSAKRRKTPSTAKIR